jgi:hypothetical protein
MNERNFQREVRFLFLGGWGGSAVLLTLCWMLEWHNTFVRIALVSLGYIVGGVAVGSFHDHFFGDSD